MADPLAPARRILIAVGGNDVDVETVRLSCRMARRQDAKIYAVHVIEVNRSLPLGATMDNEVQRAEQILDEVEQIGGEVEMEIETELLQARETGPAILGEADEWGAELIVMGLPYKRRFGEFNLGKTVPYILKNASMRVMLFRETLAGAEPPG
ncbi:MAG: universal stress protein [Candidatus Dormibacteraceae bacterium]